MGEKKTRGQRCFRVLPPHANDRPPRRAGLVVINQAQNVLLPVLKLKRVTDELALGDEADLLDERDDVGRSDGAERLRALLTAGHRTSWRRSPMDGRPVRARTWLGPRERPCGSEAWPSRPSGRQ